MIMLSKKKPDGATYTPPGFFYSLKGGDDCECEAAGIL